MANKAEQLSEQITKKLLTEIQTGIFADASSLPPEVELAEQLNVSRNILRECLSGLEREGWIIKKHGVGTLINKSVVHIHTRLDLGYERSINQTLELNGKHGETAYVKYLSIAADAELAGKLHILAGDPVLRVSRTILANGKPSIFIADYIVESLIADHNFTEADLEPSIFSFMEHFCNGAKVETDLAEMRAMPVTEEVAQALNVPMTCALFYLTEVGYDLHSNPLLYSEEYFLDRVIPQIIVRKKI